MKKEIDIARLHVDAKYWDEVAPNDATHMIDEMRFVKWVGGEEWEIYFWEDEEKWGRPTKNWSLNAYLGRYGDWDVVARPACPDESGEWNGEGYPPAGTKCEFKGIERYDRGNFASDWEPCTVKYASEGGAFLLDCDGDEIFMDSEDYDISFKPIDKEPTDMELFEKWARAEHDIRNFSVNQCGPEVGGYSDYSTTLLWLGWKGGRGSMGEVYG